MTIQLLYHKKVHLTKFIFYLLIAFFVFIGLVFLIPNVYFNVLFVLPVFVFGLYHLFEWQRLSNILRIKIEANRIGFEFNDSTEWLNKTEILRTSLYYSTIDKPIASVTLCVFLTSGRSIRIPGVPEIDKLIEILY